MNALLLSLLSGIALFFIIYTFSGQSENSLDSSTKERLKKIKNKAYNETRKNNAKQNVKIMIHNTEYKIKGIGKLLSKIKFTNKIKKMLKLADLDITVDVFFVSIAVFCLPFVLLGIIFYKKAVFFFIIAGLIITMPFFILNMIIKKKLETFTQQFPDALGMISSSLRAGHSLTSSFNIVVNEMPEPINKVFKVVMDDISLGRDTREALNGMTQMIPQSVDLRFFVTAVLIQREIGGNLTEILDKLSDTIRERFKLIGQLKAQTSQAKMSGFVLAIAPIAIGFIIWFLNPEYMEPLFSTSFGKMALGGAFLSAVTGFIVILKITDIRI